MTSSNAAAPRGRMARTYRYSDRFIRVVTIVLCVILVVFPVVGVILLASSDSPDPQPVGLTLLIVGIAGPILAGAVLGGNAISKGGGWAGLLFFVGFAGVTVAPGFGGLLFGVVGAIVTLVIGAVLLLLSVVAFYNIGWKAKVPMWLQLPMFGSPRLYFRGHPTVENGGDPDRDTTLPNQLDER